jgi:hypothetical protein
MSEKGARRLSLPGLARARVPNWLVNATPGLIVTILLLGLHMAQVPAVVQLGSLLFDTYQRAEPRAYEDAPVGQIIGRDTRSTLTGAGVGAALGTAVALSTRSGSATLPEGSLLGVRLNSPLQIP